MKGSRLQDFYEYRSQGEVLYINVSTEGQATVIYCFIHSVTSVTYISVSLEGEATIIFFINVLTFNILRFLYIYVCLFLFLFMTLYSVCCRYLSLHLIIITPACSF